MIPRFEVRLDSADWRLEPLRALTFDEWESGDFTATQGYSPLGQVSWSEVEDALSWEREALCKLDAGVSSIDAFEEAAEKLDFGEFGGEIGTSGLVLALLAAGFLTFTSCRGHVDSRWDVPFVGFVADEAHLEVLSTLAAGARCAIRVRAGEGLVEVFAERVTGLHELAGRILAAAHEFDALGVVAFADG